VSNEVTANHPPHSPQALRLLLSGGGTGGHIFPALTTLRVLKRKLLDAGRGLDALWVGEQSSLEQRIAQGEGIAFTSVAVGKLRRDKNPLKMLSPANMKDMAKVPWGIAQARSVINTFQPDVVLTTGGYVALPVGVAAAKFCHRPLVIHEQTVRLGLTNKLLASMATRIAVSAETSLPLLSTDLRDRAIVTGNPVRPELLQGNRRKAVEALRLHGFDARLPTVWVTGGSKGAKQINGLVQACLPWLLERANVLHQCGQHSIDDLRGVAAALPPPLAGRYRVTEFVGPELPDVLALADVVISRSGAGSIAELTALGKAAVLIPLASSAGNEQLHNAHSLEERGAAVAVTGDVTADTLRTVVTPLLANRAQRDAMAARARALGKPDAANRLAEVLLSAAPAP
jgi:UDP-N-acetylglucosamine--N-acetylmuramyl-(pentapeptide) pyrophosphoryl-undecaprenol N-acetylglucosamine transferase